jgi:hypothetical protein
MTPGFLHFVWNKIQISPVAFRQNYRSPCWSGFAIFYKHFRTCEDKRVIHHGQLNGLHDLIDGSGELSAAAVLTYLTFLNRI